MREDGERLVYSTIGPPPGSPSGALIGFGTSQLGPSGWLSTSIGFPYNIESTEIFTLFAPLLPVSFSEDLEATLWASLVPLTPGAPPEGETSLYLEVPGKPLELVSEVGEIFVLEYPSFAGISSDGSWIVFDTSKHLLPADAGRTEGKSIYAWHDGDLQLVDVNTSGALLSACGATISNSNGMSASGNRVFFAVPASCNGTEKVYLRDIEDQTTTEISKAECTRLDCNAPADVTFAGATRDGSVAYMTTTQQLTNDDEDSKRDLYSYDVDTTELTLLSGGSAAQVGVVNKVPAFPAEVGGRVYFGAIGELFPGESGTAEKLFVADGSGTRFVAEAPIPLFSEEQQIQLTPDGGRALFITSAQILAGDTDSQADAYLYDADEEELTRVSTGPSGGNGSFPVSITAPTPLNMHEFEAGNLRPYYAIDASGEHVFFTTEESLLPGDTNGDFDIYESWNGALGLISPGDQAVESSFAGISRDGRSAMFATNADLVAADQDGNARDLYAARIGGGFPQTEKPGCDGASCPLATSSRLSRGTPPSSVQLLRKHGRLRLLEIESKATKGTIAVVVSVPEPGLVSGLLWTRDEGKKIVLARGVEGAIRPGKTRLTLRLTRFGKGSAAGVRKVHLTISGGGAKLSQLVKVKFR